MAVALFRQRVQKNISALILYKSPDTMDKPPTPASRAVPRPGEGKRGTEGYIAYLLRQAAGAARLATERALADLGATPPQFMVLTVPMWRGWRN
jgi:hypothetical protein